MAALAGLALLTACEPAVEEPLPDRNPPVHDAYDGEWQVGPNVVEIGEYDPAVHRLTAIVADSTVNLHDARWLDDETVVSQGTPVLPLVADGPLWDYSVNGSVLTQANPLFPINRVINLDETPDRLIIAQGVNNAHPVFHNGWNAVDEAMFNDVVADAGAGVDCIVIVTPGYKTGPGNPTDQYGPADPDERANLDEAASWMRAKAATSSRFVLADWHAVSVSRPEWWLNDVHPDDDGSDQYEAVITRAARRCPDPVSCPAATTTVSNKLIEAAYEDFIGATSVSSGDLTYWRSQLATSGYCTTSLFGQLTKDDTFSSEVIDDLYRQLLGRAASASDLTYWRSGVEAQSTTVADLTQGIVASPEFTTVAGGTTGAFVDRLYSTMLGRTASASERSYWVGQVGATSKGIVGRAIFQSAEGRDRRAAALGQRYLGRTFSPMEKKYWRSVLSTNGGNDVAMAVSLAKLPEYRRTAQTR